MIEASAFFSCPLRPVEICSDIYSGRDETCSFCGSISPLAFDKLKALAASNLSEVKISHRGDSFYISGFSEHPRTKILRYNPEHGE